jgi:hypothetical protein
MKDSGVESKAFRSVGWISAILYKGGPEPRNDEGYYSWVGYGSAELIPFPFTAA